MSAAVIETRALGRRFAGVTALHALDLTVGAGEAVAVFGPNGAGKSTLLRLLATLLRPSGGVLRLFERAVNDGGAAARRRVGFLSHQSFLYPDLTPTENLDFYARMFRVPQPPERVRALIERVGLTGWAHRPVRTLSRGLEQRCALARALVHEPELLLLDEPFTGLDVDASDMLSGMLRETHAKGTTLLMTTHDMARGFQVCRRAIVLARGRLVWDGSIAGMRPDDFERRYHELTQPPPGSALSPQPSALRTSS
ncbi:MAG TPA: heme ABC exporter ATP-binding protein CcmA [Candidatus Margulisiibacteriota bacterium]|nr:heme ABC exporter ATP-binding protein CcmA [Candidatus Margulisiibacteriota bacterium]